MHLEKYKRSVLLQNILHLCLYGNIYSIETGKRADKRINLPGEMDFVMRTTNKTTLRQKQSPKWTIIYLENEYNLSPNQSTVVDVNFKSPSSNRRW